MMYSNKSKFGREPIRSIEALKISQAALDGKVRRYLVSHKPDIDGSLRQKLELRASQELNAANLISRVQVASSLERELQTHLTESETSNVFFVTVISRVHAVKAADHGSYDLVAHRNWITSLLEDRDYVGMIEPAYYRTVAFLASQEHWISWHVHLIVWNTDNRAMRTIKSAVNEQEIAFRPDGLPFHFRKASPSEIEAEIAYICKSPRSEYQAYQPAQTVAAHASGQPTPVRRPTTQNKREIRTKNLLAVLSVLSDKTVKSLIVAGGAGKAIRKRALKSARRTLEKDYAKHKQRLREL